MIYCPNCHTSNRLGSRYCNECGSELPPSPLVREPELVEDEPPPLDEAPNAPAPDWIARALAGLPRSREQGAVATAEGDHGGSPVRVDDTAATPSTVASANSSSESEAPFPGGPTGDESTGLEAAPAEPGLGRSPQSPFEGAPPGSPADSSPGGSRGTSAQGSAARAAGQLALRGLLVLVLSALVLLPAPEQFPPRWAQAAPAGSGVHRMLAQLPTGTPVLVAADYEPAFASNLDPQTTALIDDVLGLGLRVLVVSTLPEGPALAERLLAHARADYPGIAAGDQFANLGYLEGGASALHAFADNPRQTAAKALRSGRLLNTLPASDALGAASDFGLILVVSGRAEPVQAWIEQVGSRPGARLVAVVGATAARRLGHYLALGELEGVIVVQAGAAQREFLSAR